MRLREIQMVSVCISAPGRIPRLQLTIDVNCGAAFLTGCSAGRNRLKHSAGCLPAFEQQSASQSPASRVAHASQTKLKMMGLGLVWLTGLGIRAP
jgi:hypothetical protein